MNAIPILALALGALALPRFEAPAKSADTPEAIDAEMARIVALRELDPDDPTTLEAYSAILARKGDVDGQTAYLISALDAYDRTEVDDVKAKEKTQKRLSEMLTKLDPETAALRGFRDDYLKDLTWALQLYANNQKKYDNALELAGRILRYRPDHSLAKSIVDQIKKKNDPDLNYEANRLISLRELSRPRSFLVKWADEHENWGQAGIVETDGYVVRCNIGYDVLQLAARGLDQISRYYTSFYCTDRSAQKGKTDVFLCRMRDDYVKQADLPEVTDNPGVMAFITAQREGESAASVKMTFQVFGFDPRDVARPLESLWPILWHEASHQYMHLATGAYNAPSWLHEGMACYFEGARIASDGTITVGLPAMERLQDLMSMLEADVRPLEPLFAAQGLLDGQLYAPAWGLVYYLRHTPRTEGKPFLRDLLSNCVKLCGQREISGKSVFQEAVLGPLGMKLEEFETQWIEAMKAMFERESNPRECADEFLKLGDAELAASRDEAAFDAYRDALLRAPGDAKALLGLARVSKIRSDRARNKDEKLKDVTLTFARRACQAASRQRDSDVEKKAGEIAQGVDPAGFKKVSDGERSYRKSVEGLITKKLAQQKPRTALALAGRYLDDILGGGRQSELAAQLRASDTLSLERTLRVFDGKTLDGLSAPPRLFQVADGELVCTVERPERAPLYVEQALSPLFRFEGEVQLADANVILGLSFSQPGQTGSRGFALRPKAQEDPAAPAAMFLPFDPLPFGKISELHEGYSRELGLWDLQIGPPKKLATPVAPATWVSFRFLRESLDWLTLEIDGKEVGKRKIQAFDERSSVGIVVYGGTARFRNLRAVEIDRL